MNALSFPMLIGSRNRCSIQGSTRTEQLSEQLDKSKVEKWETGARPVESSCHITLLLLHKLESNTVIEQAPNLLFPKVMKEHV